MFTKTKNLRQLIFGCLLLSLNPWLRAANQPITQSPWHGKIYDVKLRRLIDKQDFIGKLASHRIVVLGEKHYSEHTQNVEGDIIRELGQITQPSPHPLTTAWEFLVYANQIKIENLFDQYRQKELSTEKFLELIHSNEKSFLYAPLVTATEGAHGRLLAVNLSREDKAPIVEKGLSGIDPQLIPPDFAMGGSSYFKRFELALAGHGTPEKLKNYFEAQCLTDDVMAYHLVSHDESDRKVLVTGSFHSDFNDGVVARLKARAGASEVVSVRLLDLDDYVEEELNDYIHDPEYGDIADFIYFIREPFVVPK